MKLIPKFKGKCYFYINLFILIYFFSYVFQNVTLILILTKKNLIN